MKNVVIAVAAVLALSACGTGAADTAPAPPAGVYTTSQTALVQKADTISQDDCTIRPPNDAYPDCARWVAEIGNLSLGAQSIGGGPVAGRLAGEVGQFSRTGCVASPGVAGPPATTCGAIMRSIQADLKALKTQLDATAAKPT